MLGPPPPNGESSAIMTGESSLPPLKKNDGKLGLLALLLLLGAGGLWFASREDSPEPEATPAEPPPAEVAPREEVAVEIEIPDDAAENIQTVGDAVKYITGKLS